MDISHPLTLPRGGTHPPADVLQGRGNDLDIQQRHEHPDAHDHKGQNLPDPAQGFGGVAHRPALSDESALTLPTFTLAVTESPGRNWPDVATSSSTTTPT